MVGIALPNRHWNFSAVDGNVITTSRIYENLWMFCAMDSTRVHNCLDFASLLALSGMWLDEILFYYFIDDYSSGSEPNPWSPPFWSHFWVWRIQQDSIYLLLPATVNGWFWYTYSSRHFLPYFDVKLFTVWYLLIDLKDILGVWDWVGIFFSYARKPGLIWTLIYWLYLHYPYSRPKFMTFHSQVYMRKGGKIDGPLTKFQVKFL